MAHPIGELSGGHSTPSISPSKTCPCRTKAVPRWRNPVDENETIFGPMWPQILEEITRDLADEPSPSETAE
jgi:hypothetical protein